MVLPTPDEADSPLLSSRTACVPYNVAGLPPYQTADGGAAVRRGAATARRGGATARRGSHLLPALPPTVSPAEPRGLVLFTENNPAHIGVYEPRAAPSGPVPTHSELGTTAN